ncbi:MAG: heme lyase CcmF/NrfE family subunit [bacterium]|nr:heme lyase CcmF/NrfE family subunit [bacterium]
MITTIGYYSLIISAVFALYTFIAVIFGIKFKSYSLVESSKNGLLVSFIFVSITSFALLYSLLNRDFSIEYVYEHTSRTLSLLYTISAFWAGQKGSLLFWAWIMALFNAVLILTKRKKEIEFFPYVISIISFIQFFFLFVLVRVADPFTRVMDTTTGKMFTPPDGYGLNPLLQNPGMIWHPPTLFIGYVGYTIPFAFAIAALISKKLDNEWIKDIRRWSLFSWFFLSLGILLGAQWAYVELGWGGYWAWDPIENASLMPWLVGTAFIHSAMIQEKKEMLKTWNMVLIILTFILCVFGTFLTRSGVLSSVHAFGETGVGPYFISFISLCLAGSLLLLIIRRKYLKNQNEMESMISKENMFLFNNFILFSIFFVTFWGTMFPVFSELFTGVKLTVGQSYFNKANVPLGTLLLILMAVCPLISWGKTSPQNFKKNFLLPVIISGISLVVFYILGNRKIIALIPSIFVVFVIMAIIVEFYRGTIIRHQNTGKNYFTSFFALIWSNKRRYGGYIVHIGIVMMFVGMIGIGAYSIEKDVENIKIGSTIEIGKYKLTYDDLQAVEHPDKQSVYAVLTVYKNNKSIYKLRPEKGFFPNHEQPTTEVAIATTLLDDLYVILNGYNANTGNATFRVLINPLVVWMWLGGIVIFIGTTIAFCPNRKKNEK